MSEAATDVRSRRRRASAVCGRSDAVLGRQQSEHDQWPRGDQPVLRRQGAPAATSNGHSVSALIAVGRVFSSAPPTAGVARRAATSAISRPHPSEQRRRGRGRDLQRAAAGQQVTQHRMQLGGRAYPGRARLSAAHRAARALWRGPRPPPGEHRPAQRQRLRQWRRSRRSCDLRRARAGERGPLRWCGRQRHSRHGRPGSQPDREPLPPHKSAVQ